MSSDLDDLVRRAQRGDPAAVERLLGALRGPLARQLRRIGVAAPDVDDVVQDALLDVHRGLCGYRWESGFLGWCYTIAARRAMRAAHARAALELTDRLETWLAEPEPALAPAEEILVEQAVHLRCALAVARGLSPALRRAYLLGEVLHVPDVVGAEALGITRAAFRQRVARARRLVAAEIRIGLTGRRPDGEVPAAAADELHRLLSLGELHRAHGRPATADGALRALETAAPLLGSPAGGA